FLSSPRATYRYLHSFPTRRSSDLPYMIERGVRFADEPIQLRSGPVLGSVTVGVRVQVMETRRPFLANRPEDLAPFGDSTPLVGEDRKSTRLNSSHVAISYAVFCLK